METKKTDNSKDVNVDKIIKRIVVLLALAGYFDPSMKDKIVDYLKKNL